jgi:hypothetical protein
MNRKNQEQGVMQREFVAFLYGEDTSSSKYDCVHLYFLRSCAADAAPILIFEVPYFLDSKIDSSVQSYSGRVCREHNGTLGCAFTGFCAILTTSAVKLCAGRD